MRAGTTTQRQSTVVGFLSEQPWAGSVTWRERSALSGADLADFLALWRVCGRADCGVDRVGERFVEGRHPVLPFLADAVAVLIEVGLAVLGDSDSGRRRVLVTASGRARYEELCDRQGIPPYAAVVIDGTLGR